MNSACNSETTLTNYARPLDSGHKKNIIALSNLNKQKFAISQSEAMSTVLTSCDIKSLTWYSDDITCTCRGFIKGQAPGKLIGCERNLAINLPGCFCLLFLLSFKRKTKNAWLKNPTDLLHKSVMKPLQNIEN